MTDARAPFSSTPPPCRALSLSPGEVVAVWSRALASMPHLDALFGVAEEAVWRPGPWGRLGLWGRLGRVGFARRSVGAVACWGADTLSARARACAKRLRVPFISLGEGFFHSLDARRRRTQPYSLVLDASGIHYDATRPCDLESMLEKGGWESPELLAEARAAIDAILRNRLGKYNQAPDAPPYMLTTPGLRTRVLVLDQALDDHRVRPGMADSGSFVRMLESARRDHPGAALFLRVPSRVLAGGVKGYLADSPAARGVTLISRDVSPLSLLAQADEVYTVNSQMGFEALLLGKRVHCFGLPFYAGWGLTDDSLSSPRRTRTRSVEELFAAACMLYARYVNPVTGEACTIHDTIRLLTEQRLRNEENAVPSCCLGFSRRRFRTVRPFLSSTAGGAERHGEAEAVRRAESARGRIAVPPSRADDALLALCARQGIDLLRVQRGFFPDLEAGQALFPAPLSLLMDAKGLYDDPSRPSRLETVLEQYAFTPELRARGAAVGAWLAGRGLLCESEFAAHGRPRLASAREHERLWPPLDGGRRVLLVPGQDESSAAVTLGGQGIHANRELVRAVRRARPDDCIVYLNTPGAKNKLSTDHIPEADFVPAALSLTDALARAHELHTLSSVVGLDALVRGLPVFTYGGPFYAGWGLTRDRLSFARRSRPLTLDSLLAGVLIVCSAYFDWNSRLFCGPEELMRLHDMPRKHDPPLLRLARRLVAAYASGGRGSAPAPRWGK